MRFNIFAGVLIASAGLGLAKDCTSDACIKYYSDNGCTMGLELGSYLPDCTGNCFSYASFSSILVLGNTFTGAGCTAYSDYNCQNEISHTGNQHTPTCLGNLNGQAQSMKCYYGC